MLGKLIKHEFKVTGKMFLLLYAATLILTIFEKIMMYIDIDNPVIDMFFMLITVAYVILLIALFFVTAGMLIMRFYRNMLGDEGYLTFTLPVTASQHLISKTVVAFVWMVLSAVVMVVSIIIISWSPEMIEGINEFWKAMKPVLELDGIPTLMIILILTMVIGLINFIVTYQCAMSIGQLFSKHKVLGSVVGYFIINSATQIITGVITVIGFKTNMFGDMQYELNSLAETEKYFGDINNVLWFSIAISIVFIVIEFFLSKYLLEKKLNLE